jgi:hypothetical protein
VNPGSLTVLLPLVLGSGNCPLTGNIADCYAQACKVFGITVRVIRTNTNPIPMYYAVPELLLTEACAAIREHAEGTGPLPNTITVPIVVPHLTLPAYQPLASPVIESIYAILGINTVTVMTHGNPYTTLMPQACTSAGLDFSTLMGRLSAAHPAAVMRTGPMATLPITEPRLKMYYTVAAPFTDVDRAMANLLGVRYITATDATGAAFIVAAHQPATPSIMAHLRLYA